MTIYGLVAILAWLWWGTAVGMVAEVILASDHAPSNFLMVVNFIFGGLGVVVTLFEIIHGAFKRPLST